MRVASVGCFPGAWRRDSWNFQVASLHLLTIKHGYSLCPLHTIFASWASVAGGVCRPRSEALKYVLLSSDAKRHPSRLLAHTGAQYEISDLREIYGAGTRNSAYSSGGCSSGGGPQSPPVWRHVRQALAPPTSPETRGIPSSRAGPSQNGGCSGGGIGRKILAGRSTVIYFRFGRTRVCIKRQLVCTLGK